MRSLKAEAGLCWLPIILIILVFYFFVYIGCMIQGKLPNPDRIIPQHICPIPEQKTNPIANANYQAKTFSVLTKDILSVTFKTTDDETEMTILMGDKK